MTLGQITELLQRDIELRHTIAEFAEHDAKLVVNGVIAMPLQAVHNSYRVASMQNPADLEVTDENGNRIGVVVFGTALGYIDLAMITDAQYAAYLTEVEPQELGQPFHFSADYLVIDQPQYDRYVADFLDGAPLWGGLVHDQAPQPHAYLPPTIRALPHLAFPTPYHRENCIRSVLEPFAFERFLKLYHLLELLFDWDVVHAIRALGDDLQGIGQILGRYEKDELTRLKDTINARCTDRDRLAGALNAVSQDQNFKALAKTIFFEYGKSGNPQAQESQFDAAMANGFVAPANPANPQSRMNWEASIVSTAAYWIYRVRCCIAHQRIGEYVMGPADERFVVEFAEPLIREVLYQAFSP
jgi:hypothetical protein